MRENAVCTAAEVAALEQEAVRAGATWSGLMDRAGAEVARFLFAALPPGENRILALAGPGNNGGDALVVARIAGEKGIPVRVVTWQRKSQGDQRLREPLSSLKVPVIELAAPLDRADLDVALEWCTIVVDGLFGTGLARDLTGDTAELVRIVQAAGQPIVAVDIPSGVSSDTGAVRGVALRCHLTVALGTYKYGHFQQPGASLAGSLKLGDIGLSDNTSKSKASGELLTDKRVTSMLPERPEDSNKGTYGKAMIVAGSVNYVGSAALATEGAMRSGAGLVTLGCAAELLSIYAVKLTECTFLPLPSDLGVISERAVDKLRTELKDYKSLLIGCGLSTEKEAGGFVRGLLTQQRKTAERSIGFAVRRGEAQDDEAPEAGSLPPLVLDGDALNILSEWDDWHKSVPHGTVLTPHPGEMARLVKGTVDEVQADRVKCAKDAAAEWDQVVVLKGAGTLIAEPGGNVFVSPFANPALATAGSGDVLAGTIAGLLAQGLSAVDAACVGVYAHGMAGQLLRDEFGPSGGLAGELPVLIARAIHTLREGK